MVALHGCMQDAEDFAAGTRLDEHVERLGLAVIYPEQDDRANANRCWNWFRPENQLRDGPEPAAILALVEEIVAANGIDRARIFVAGMSAGAAAAAVLGEQAPDVFAGVALMAGVALHAASDVASAYAAMNGETDPDTHALRAAATRHARAYRGQRALVWTGRDDVRVAPQNARVLATQFAELYGLGAAASTEEPEPDGIRVMWRDGTGVRVELREIDGLAHAWSGGSRKGSGTAPGAPDFTGALLQFFLGPGAVERVPA